MSWLTSLLGFGSSRTVEKAIGLASEHIEDKDKRNELVVELVRIQAQTDIAATIPWVDAIHKMGRQLMWWGVIGAWLYAKSKGIAIDIGELVALITGPAAYTLLKGRGQ